MILSAVLLSCNPVRLISIFFFLTSTDFKGNGPSTYFSWVVLKQICFLQLSHRAGEIYNSFLSSKATMPVNIDSQAQLADDVLTSPRPDMFKTQQLQVPEGWFLYQSWRSSPFGIQFKILCALGGFVLISHFAQAYCIFFFSGGHLGLFTKGLWGFTREINTNWHTPTENVAHTALYRERHAVRDVYIFSKHAHERVVTVTVETPVITPAVTIC